MVNGWRAWVPWCLLLQAAFLGWASAAACGCGSDGGLLIVTVLMLVLGGQAARWSLPSTHPEQRLIGRFLWVLLVLVCAWLALQSRGHVLLLGAFALILAWALIWWMASPEGRRWVPLGVTLGAVVMVALSDVVQRQAWLWIPSATALSWAMLVGVWAAYRWWPKAPHAWGARVAMLMAHGVLAISVWAQVSPGAAAWGLLTVLALAWRPSERMAGLVALLHGAALTLALWRMGWY